MQVLHYNNDIKTFILTLPPTAQQRCYRAIDLLIQHGHALRMPFSKPLTSGLFELRVHGSESVRIIYAYRFGAAILLLGFVKKTETTPQRIIAAALTRLAHVDSGIT